MSKKNKTKRSGSAGSFFFGSFIGFILCLGLLFGIGCFAYFKVSPAWLNKTFKTDIDLGNEDINNKTLKDLVTGTVGLVKNVDTYTLNDLKADFGIEIKDELFGLDITDLKTVGLSDLPDAVTDMFSNISADELRDVLDLQDMSKVLDKSNTYYFNSVDNKLYEKFDGTTYSNLVDFDYEVNEAKTKITTKKHESSIVMNEEHSVVNQVDIQLWYLPLTDALGGFTSNMGSQITLKDLETDYGVELPSFLDKVDKENTTINELEDAINGLYVADFLGYTVEGSSPNLIVKDKDKQNVTGLMYELAIETIDGLKDIDSKFSSLTASDLKDSLGLSSLDNIMEKSNTYFVSGTKLYEDEAHTTEVDFEYEISASSVEVDKASYAISGEEVKIKYKSLPLATAISTFTSNMGDNLTLQELQDDYGVVLPGYIVNGNETKTINEIQTIIDNVLVADVLGYTIDADKAVWNGTTKVTGIMSIIAQKKVRDLKDIQSTIEGETIATLMDYTIDGNGDVYNGTEKVTGLLGKVAKYTIKNVDSAVNDLELSDVFTTEQLSDGVFKLLDQSTVGSIKVVNVAKELSDAIQVSTMGELQEAGLIKADYDLSKQIDTNLDGTKDTEIALIPLDTFVNIAITILTK